MPPRSRLDVAVERWRKVPKADRDAIVTIIEDCMEGADEPDFSQYDAAAALLRAAAVKR